jgi:cell division protein ZapA
MKQVEVSISGQPYTLSCPEGGEALLASAVAAVDREMNTIREAGKVKARERVAVLAALNVAYQLAERKAGAGQAKSVASATAPEASDSDIEALMRRIDTALAEDGQLL